MFTDKGEDESLGEGLLWLGNVGETEDVKEDFRGELIDGDTLVSHGVCQPERRFQRISEFEELCPIAPRPVPPSHLLAAREVGNGILSDDQ